MIQSAMKNEFLKSKRQKKIYVSIFIMLILVVVRVLSNALEDGIVVNGQTLPFVVIVMDITQYVPFFIIILMSDILTEDYRAGTLKLSLMRPITRFEILLAKFLSLSAFVLIINLAIIIGAYIVGTIYAGWGSDFHLPARLMDEFGYTTGNDIVMSTANGILATLGATIIETLAQLGFAAIILFVGICFNSLTSVVGIGIFLYAVFMITMKALFKYSPIYLISSTYDICIAPLGVMSTSSIVLRFVSIFAYIIIFFAAGTVLFRRKDLLA